MFSLLHVDRGGGAQFWEMHPSGEVSEEVSGMAERSFVSELSRRRRANRNFSKNFAEPEEGEWTPPEKLRGIVPTEIF